MPKIVGVNTSGLPVGNIVPHGGTSLPQGFLWCDGSPVLISSYPGLAAALYDSSTGKYAHGDGTKLADGVTSSGYAAGTAFNLPDYRGRFLRGIDGATGRDPDTSFRTIPNTNGNLGNNVGSIQGHAFQNHSHTVYGFENGQGGGASSFYALLTNSTNSHNNDKTSAASGATGAYSQSSAYETRPLNAYVNYIISYK
jgi:hypothetical protein